MQTIDFRDLFVDNQIKKLKLDNNYITYIGEQSFVNMFDLSHLDLSFNKLFDLKREIFFNVRSLTYLDVAFNLIGNDLNEGLFDFQFQLSYLNLSHNQIEYLRENLFSNLFNLQTLDISSNKLKLIQNNLFDSLGQLHILVIANNTNVYFEDKSLKGLKSIKDFWIDFKSLINNQNNIIESLRLQQVKNVSDVTYYQSIYINYEDKDILDCNLMLRFIKKNLQINLKSDFQYKLFLEKCFSFELFKLKTN